MGFRYQLKSSKAILTSPYGSTPRYALCVGLLHSLPQSI